MLALLLLLVLLTFIVLVPSGLLRLGTLGADRGMFLDRNLGNLVILEGTLL